MKVEDLDDKQLIARARNEHANEECEIDENAVVSRNDDNGAWVAAWVYIQLDIDET